jgi:hypothetical protein
MLANTTHDFSRERGGAAGTNPKHQWPNAKKCLTRKRPIQHAFATYPLFFHSETLSNPDLPGLPETSQ